MSPFHSEALNRLVTRKIDHDETILWSAERCRATSSDQTIHWIRLISFLSVSAIIFLTPFGGIYRSFLFKPGLFLFYGFLFLSVLILSAALDVFSILRANRFAYVVTNKRILILNDFLIPMSRAMMPEEIEFVGLIQYKDRGTITLRYASSFYFDLNPVDGLRSQLLPRMIMNAPDAQGAIKPLNALLQMKKERQAEEASIPQLNQGLFKPTKWG